MVKNPPAHPGDMGLLPGLGSPTRLGASQPAHHLCWACAQSPRASGTEPAHPKQQEEPRAGEPAKHSSSLQPEESPAAPKT